jgi:hypothetical protein
MLWLRHWLAERFAAPNLTVALAGKAPLAARRAGIERFDALIVDEGQDLLQLALLDPLDRTLVGGLEQGRWCLFHDRNNQAGLFGPAEPEALDMLNSFGPTHVRRTTNCRNTRQILELVKTSLGADMGVRGSGDGPAVRLHQARGEAEAVSLLTAELERLTGRGGLAPPGGDHSFVPATFRRIYRRAAGAGACVEYRRARRIRPTRLPATRLPSAAPRSPLSRGWRTRPSS